MNNNIEKLLILTEIKQLDFLPKKFEARQSIQKKLMSELNNDFELIKSYHCTRNTRDTELLEELKQYEDKVVYSIKFMESPEYRRFIEEQFCLGKTTILNDYIQRFHNIIQPSYEEKKEIIGELPKQLEKKL